TSLESHRRHRCSRLDRRYPKKGERIGNQMVTYRGSEMKFTDFAGNERIVEHFKKALERKQLGHAYLFSGPAGTGKSTLARLICKTLWCKKPGPTGPDNECASCHKFDSGNHSDFHYFEPDGLYFKIDLVRQIIHQASLRPVESQWKTFVLEGADLMRDEAA